ncbi:arrestin (macronuclear) [Tetrahymena thermophila SB210]|uniref:Arrestin n=1 Tax=Tetrahymena thermophila (strain SB210) TaxID=312017 RepID=Q23QU8_TETTS|nr:arrestin [Tetrahymena thermophila SB210]EAR98790.1 arrestin [Tetrahymena thermophila SB210]|eukprot:XP_001019035.1 arrestin [Tetrahymena thermophila SB210]
MGQSQPKDNRRQVKGGIYIQLQKTAFVSNQVIQGMLNINLEEPFQGHILQVTLVGLEETHFTYTVGSGKHRRTVHARGYNSFLNFSLPIYDFAQGTNDTAFIIHPCQIQIPFQMNVADKLPSSMKYFYSQHTQCSLKYTLFASIIPTEANVKPIGGSQEIFIGQQIPSLELQNMTNSIQEPVICCCCRSGQIKYNIQTNGRSFAPNENIQIKLDVDFSQYGKKVNNLNVKLLGQLIMKASNTQRTKYINIFEKMVNVKVEKTHINENVQLQVPGNVTLSCQGSLIQVNYFLEFYPEISTCCCVSKSSPHEIKIYINPNSSQAYNFSDAPQQLQIMPPQNWNPTQLQPTQFTSQQTSYIQQQSLKFVSQEEQYLYQQNAQQQNPQLYPYQQSNMNGLANPMTSQIQQPNQSPYMKDQNQYYL